MWSEIPGTRIPERKSTPSLMIADWALASMLMVKIISPEKGEVGISVDRGEFIKMLKNVGIPIGDD